MDTIGFVGGGNMAEALIKGILAAKLYERENIFVSDIRPERLEYLAKTYGVGTTEQNSKLAENAKIIVLCVKPQHINEALQSIQAALGPDRLVISIAAGVKTADIADVLGDIAIVRVMPNTPALIGEGTSALFACENAKPGLEKAKSIFSAVGEAVIVDDEQLIDAVTAVSGSGPAYYFLLTEELLKAASQLGLPEDMAKKLVLQTAKGAALLAVWADNKGQNTAELRKNVTSPGGTTQAALKVFEKSGFSKMVQAAVRMARDRARELSG